MYRADLAVVHEEGDVVARVERLVCNRDPAQYRAPLRPSADVRTFVQVVNSHCGAGLTVSDDVAKEVDAAAGGVLASLATVGHTAVSALLQAVGSASGGTGAAAGAPPAPPAPSAAAAAAAAPAPAPAEVSTASREELAQAAFKFDWDKVLRLVRAQPSLVNTTRPVALGRSPSGWTALHQAAYGGASVAGTLFFFTPPTPCVLPFVALTHGR